MKSDTKTVFMPKSPVPRPECPLYGFKVINNTMLPEGTARCAIATGESTFCVMEKSGQKPNWAKCSRLSEKFLEVKKKTADGVVGGDTRYAVPDGERDLFIMSPNGLSITFVFPEEFRPDCRGGWRGLSLREWFGYVVGANCPRPR